MGELIFALVAIWIVYIIWQGYQAEATKKPITLKDGGQGIMEPVCPQCQARLVTVTRPASNWAADVFSMIFGLAGVVLILFNWIAGGITLILAIIIALAGKGKTTVLTCPACGQDARTIH